MKTKKKVVTLSRDEMRTVIGGGIATSPLGFKPGKVLSKVSEVQSADVCPRLIGD